MDGDDTDLHRGEDGRMRCWWATGPGPLVRYHDEEWARGPRDETGLFERLSLEAFQGGLSWWVVLRRRDALRNAFADFVPERVASFDATDVARILGNPGVIRNRAKIEAVIHNAQALLDLHAAGSGLATLTAEVLASAASDEPLAPPRRRSDVPGWTSTSRALAQCLRDLGWSFVGPTTAYAYLQAVGWVDDHLVGCHARGSAEPLR
jgi:DNA-3-methyladenine glycosylase I